MWSAVWTAKPLQPAGFDPAVVADVMRLMRQSEYKRRQLPPGLKITGKAFGTGRRYPIAQAFREVGAILPSWPSSRHDQAHTPLRAGIFSCWPRRHQLEVEGNDPLLRP